jgi:hypothetical protein
VSAEEANFESIKKLHAESRLLREGGVPVVLLQGFAFCAAGADVKMDLLLHPAAHTGYTTRLFFDKQIQGRGANWNPHRVLDREWWAPSWQNVPATMAWPSMLCAHLKAVA